MTVEPGTLAASSSREHEELAARLSCSGVTVRFGGLVAVNDVALEVPAAEIVGLVGPNGAGKSTLFGVLSGLIRPWSGQVRLDGQDITRLTPQARAARGLARTFQHTELFAGLTVREHLVLAHRVKEARRRIWSDLFTMGSIRRASGEESDRVDGLIELLGLRSVSRRPAAGLPLGMARLVELGRALASGPRVLLLDEPSSGLDSTETEQFETALRRASREGGMSVLLVEHDVELVMRNCSAVYVLDFGELIAGGPPAEVRANPTVRAAYLGEDLPDIDGPGDENIGVVAEPQPAEPKPFGDGAPTGPDAPTRALVVAGLGVRYGEATALTGVSFEVGAGTTLAVLGANGAGKSSLARSLSGLVRPTAGRVEFAGQDITGWAAHRIRRVGIVHLPEGRGLFRELTVIDNVRMATATLKGRVVRREAVERAFHLFPLLGERRRQRAALLSGGEQQMLSLARALALSPRLLIADELSLGLAPKIVDAVFDGLVRARQAGVTIIMIEQYIDRALGFADRCIVLQRGEVAWEGPSTAARGEVARRYLGDAMTATT